MDVNAQCERKSKLLDLFFEVQEKERLDMVESRRKSKLAKYDKMFRGLVFVNKTSPHKVRLQRENGRLLKAFPLQKEIVELLTSDDHLMMVAGRRLGLWRVIHLEGIGTTVTAEDGEPNLHISFPRLDATIPD